MKEIHVFNISKILYLKRPLFLLITLMFLANMSANNNNNPKALPTSDFQLILERIQAASKKVNLTSTENNATNYLKSVLSDGSFSDIDYTDTSATNWQPQTHLDRLKPIVLAYTMPASKYYGDESTYNSIVKMFSFWQKAHPASTNWYMQEIACPQRMGILLILMRSASKQLPASLESDLLKRMKSEGGNPTLHVGANKMDVATHWIYRACLTKNAQMLSIGAEQAFHPLFLTTEEGFQHDYSYQQHGSQLYLGGYGRVVVAGVSNLAMYLTETPYALSEERLQVLSKFVREVYTPIIRGRYLMYNTLGRGLTRKNALNESGFATILNRMIILDSQNKDFYEKTIERLKESKDPSYSILPSNTHFWRSDYSLHQRPAYTIDLRMASVFTARNENGNGENTKGYFLVDGATAIVQKGDEYLDIFPVWDWAKIPGTTTPAMASIPKPSAWEVKGTSYFAGGASDGKHGVSAYLLNDNAYNIKTSAKKSWFFFDNEIVCLGAGIKSSAIETINTTLNQSLLRGDVSTINKNGSSKKLAKSEHSFSDLSWVLHDNTAYYFPQGGNISLANQSQNGTWKSINTTQTNEQITKEVFKMWINHGVSPSKATYSYIIVPNKTSVAEINEYATNDVEILANTDSVQVVRHKSLNIYGLVFYTKATFSNDEVSIQADKPCVVMLKDVGGERIKAYISDPSRQNTAINLITEFPNIAGIKVLKCSFPIYPNPYAGSTIEYAIDKNTTGYIPPKTQSIYAIADAYVRGGVYGYTNYGTEKTLVVKNDKGEFAREAYIKFDLSSIDTEALKKSENDKRIYLSLSVASTNTTIQETKWNISYVSDDTWNENIINWNNKPTPDELIISIPSSYAGTNVRADITEFALNEIEFGNKILTLQLSSTIQGNATDASFYSRESATATAPQLIVESLSPSGIESETGNSNSQIRLYPTLVDRGNPVFIEMPMELQNSNSVLIKLSDTLGRSFAVNDKNKIDTSNLMPGIYIVSINGRSFQAKFIVQ